MKLNEPEVIETYLLSFEYQWVKVHTLKNGENEFVRFELFKRFGCRYVEPHMVEDVKKSIMVEAPIEADDFLLKIPTSIVPDHLHIDLDDDAIYLEEVQLQFKRMQLSWCEITLYFELADEYKETLERYKAYLLKHPHMKYNPKEHAKYRTDKRIAVAK